MPTEAVIVHRLTEFAATTTEAASGAGRSTYVIGRRLGHHLALLSPFGAYADFLPAARLETSERSIDITGAGPGPSDDG